MMFKDKKISSRNRALSPPFAPFGSGSCTPRAPSDHILYGRQNPRTTCVRAVSPSSSRYLHPARTAWKPKTGFKLFPMTSWSISDGFGSPNLITTASAAVAEAQCRSNSSCVGFNTDGQYLVAPSYVSTYIGAPNPSALYMKQYCTERFGYISKPDTALRPVPAQFGIAEGKAESEAQAAEFCRLNYACTGFSSDGSYIIGGVGEYVSATGICSYVKERK
ncbi:hypothetical protein Vafri_14317 [Volvox africanus]|uniref:Uncharacterized protein n=1 Tax=Volvox africanus TaxID=51714 RepID=A0A8J4BEQ5_9CHLO|nr:hypothetical protein Vafri_14317 [Volvox africanus]